jgi:UDP-N-acetylmuramyl pentapeptide phosphotransferase/UDP-N-acetylglucosamine-1-phosphate transferase
MNFAHTAALVLAFAVSWRVTGWLIVAVGRVLVDVPNERSSHSRATPRGGGIGLLAGVAAGLGCGAWLGLPLPAWQVAAAALIVAIIGLLDDWKRMPIVLRLAAQATAAVLALSATAPLSSLPLPAPADLPLGAAAWPLTVLWIVGTLNIYNFLDGIDGHAGLEAVLTGLAVGLMAFSASASLLGFALAGASAGFLVHNWHPARIFMGDVGSTTVGFLLAVVPFSAPPERQASVVFAVAMCLWFFLADGAFTLARRVVRRERVWAAHRTHLYQRLVVRGVPHHVVAGRIGLMSLIVAELAILSARAGSPSLGWSVLAVAAAGFAVFLMWVHHCEAER